LNGARDDLLKLAKGGFNDEGLHLGQIARFSWRVVCFSGQWLHETPDLHRQISRLMNRFLLLILIGVVLNGLMVTVGAVILPPTDDSSGLLTYSGKPPAITKRTLTNLNGSGTTLPVSRTRTAFVRFAVEETGMTAGTVENARLTLFFPSVKKAGDLSLHVVTQDWEENFPLPERSRVHPAFDAPFLTIPAESVAKKQFVIVDVTQQVKDWLTNPNSNFGIAVTSPDGVAVVTIGSKEGSASGYPPLLEMEGTGATSDNTANAIVKRDGDGNFMVGTITGALVGNATTAGSAVTFTGVLEGDVAGTQGATVVSAVGGMSAANLANGANLANAATSANTANAIVKRDADGNFNVGVVTGSFVGDGSALTGLTPRIDRQGGHLPELTSNNTTTYKTLLEFTTKDMGEPGCYVINISAGYFGQTSSNARGTYAVSVNDIDVSTVAWRALNDQFNFALTVITNNVPAGSVIKFRFKSLNAGTSVSVGDARLTIDGIPQSYVVD